MSRTHKPKGKGYLYKFSKESTEVKRRCRRWYRAMSNQMVREGRYDDIPRFRGTEGWIYW